MNVCYDDLNNLRDALATKARKDALCAEYWVPEVILGGKNPRKLVNVHNPYQFFLEIFDHIEMLSEVSTKSRSSLLPTDCIYQTFIRTFASLNNEIGTALKQIAFLPFLKSNLGITILISLPTGVIGGTNRKGRRGSPFAIKNPFEIDPSLADPLLPELPAIVQYRAMMQACHKMGILAGSIVPLTVLSMDSPLFKAFPDLGFWWLAEPGELLCCKVENQSEILSSSVPSHIVTAISSENKMRFVPPPAFEKVRVVNENGHNYFVADVEIMGQIRQCTLANAFPDPVIGEDGTYTWSDVSTINYNHRSYPPPQGVPDLTERDVSKPSWRIMPHVLAWRMRELGERVFLIDVNQAVPNEILTNACSIASNWQGEYQNCIPALFKNNLSTHDIEKIYAALDWNVYETSSLSVSTAEKPIIIGEELWEFDIKSDILDGIVGPLIFCVSGHSHNLSVLIQSLKYHLQKLQNSVSQLRHFGGLGNHDTMPANPVIAPSLYLLYSFLPKVVPMVFSGIEFNAQIIVNKEFGFQSNTNLYKLKLDLSDNALGLFNDLPLNWEKLPISAETQPLSSLIKAVNDIRDRIFSYIDDGELAYRYIEHDTQPSCFGYERWSEAGSIMAFANFGDQFTTISLNHQQQWGLLISSTLAEQPETPLLDENEIYLRPRSAVVVASKFFQIIMMDKEEIL
ncbi:MAG: alpha-amylase family protein [Ktedonobacteraceae bacterium]